MIEVEYNIIMPASFTNHNMVLPYFSLNNIMHITGSKEKIGPEPVHAFKEVMELRTSGQ